MKLCIDCKFCKEEEDGLTCIYHKAVRIVINPVHGEKWKIEDKPSNMPSKMRHGTEFQFYRWKNCGMKAKFFKPKEKIVFIKGAY